MSLLNHSMRYYWKSQKYYQCQIRHFWVSHAKWARTHYQILGLPSGASQGDIKQAYYHLAIKHHPDKNEGCEDKFREVTTAYEVLGNPRLRRLYDRGLLSDEQPDASIHYPSDPSGGPTGYSEEDREKTKATVKTFDQWSQDHLRETFSRNQYDRDTQKKKEHLKSRNDSTSAENKVFLLVFVVCVVLYSLLPQRRKGGGESNGDKKKS